MSFIYAMYNHRFICIFQSSFHVVGNVNYAATSDTSKILTVMMVNDAPLSDMDVNYASPSDSPVYDGTIQS
jgi:hypothetical protein